MRGFDVPYKYSNVPTKISCKVGDRSRGWPKVSLCDSPTPRFRGGRYSFPRIAPLYPWSVSYMLSVKQGGIMYHFWSLWYDLTWDWTQVSQAIGEHSNHYTNHSNGIPLIPSPDPDVLLSFLFCCIVRISNRYTLTGFLIIHTETQYQKSYVINTISQRPWDKPITKHSSYLLMLCFFSVWI